MTSKNETIPTDLLSNIDMVFMFDTTLQQIYRWRWNKKLPFHKLPSGSSKKQPVRYSFAEIVDWAAKNGIRIVRKPKFNRDGTVEWRGKILAKEFEEFIK